MTFNKCRSCDGIGCPDCLGFGIDMVALLDQVKNKKSKEALKEKIFNFNSLTISKQRFVKSIIKGILKENL